MVEFNNIQRFFETTYPLNKHGLEELFSLFQIKQYAKSTQLLKAHQHENQLRFLNKGVVREYYATMERENNINFYVKPQFITDLSAFNEDVITQKNQEGLTDIELLVVDKISFRNLLAKYECGKAFIALSFQKLLQCKELQEYNRMTKTPEELYQKLLLDKPDWLQLIPQYHIASYLNITPETLSRIRKRIS